jgi:DNA-binding response OmpR family regulator
MRIILIEPNLTLAKTYSKALEEEGHEVVICTNSQQAIACSDESCPDVVVTELYLGDHNGVEFLYEFRSYSDWENVPILLHTMATPSEVQAYKSVLRQLGVSIYLYKPQTTLAHLKWNVSQALPSATV